MRKTERGAIRPTTFCIRGDGGLLEITESNRR
jgi:hypothetical protein